MPQAQQYEMKDSGVEWIGEMPSHWKIERAKFHFCQSFERGNKTPELLAASQKHGMYPQRLLEGVVQVMLGTDLQQFKTVHINDFVISLRSFQGGFERSAYEGVCSPAYQVFRAGKQYDVNWLKWFFKNDMFIDAMNALTVGIREGRNIKYDDFANSLFPMPPLHEQAAIAAYLDEKCATIDALIVEAKATIEEYKKWKASVIFEAVTKGLNPNAEMKDSGIEWIGRIPRLWKICKLKWLCDKITDGSHFSPETTDDGYPYITASDVNGIGLDYRNAKKISPTAFDELQKSGCRPIKGDVLLVKDGATTGRIGLMTDNEPCVVLSSVAILRPAEKVNSYYLMYVMMSEVLQFQIRKSMAGSAMPRTTLSKLVDYITISCPFHEQEAIVAYLDSKCSSIDSIISEKEALIGELESYKKSLIFETVTGKRRVCS